MVEQHAGSKQHLVRDHNIQGGNITFWGAIAFRLGEQHSGKKHYITLRRGVHHLGEGHNIQEVNNIQKGNSIGGAQHLGGQHYFSRGMFHEYQET